MIFTFKELFPMDISWELFLNSLATYYSAVLIDGAKPHPVFPFGISYLTNSLEKLA